MVAFHYLMLNGSPFSQLPPDEIHALLLVVKRWLFATIMIMMLPIRRF
jgi:hypothetical protein